MTKAKAPSLTSRQGQFLALWTHVARASITKPLKPYAGYAPGHHAEADMPILIEFISIQLKARRFRMASPITRETCQQLGIKYSSRAISSWLLEGAGESPSRSPAPVFSKPLRTTRMPGYKFKPVRQPA